MLNVICLMGRLVADPELRHTPGGVAACTFRIAVDCNFVRQGEERKADFIDIVTWRQTAEFVCKYFHKGSLLAVNGSLQTRNYEDKSGNKRTVYEVVADNVHFAESKNTSGGLQTAKRWGEEHQAVMEAADVDQDDFAVIDDNEDLPF